MWNMDGAGKGASSRTQGYVEEGNIKVYLFSDKETRVRFLTENVSLEQVMLERKLTKEQAEEYILTELLWERWIQPIANWEHTVPEVKGQRYFTTVACQGKRDCILCEANDEARNNGVTENKMLPYPVRKRFFVPAWFYDMKTVLFVKASQDFFEDVAIYINKEQGPIDFGIYKTGRGFNTKYKVVRVGASPQLDKEAIKFAMKPSEVSFIESPETIAKKLTLGRIEQSSDKPIDKPSSGAAPSQENFVIPFGVHKGKTIKEVYTVDPPYVEFLKANSSGLVQEKVKEFLSGIGKD